MEALLESLGINRSHWSKFYEQEIRLYDLFLLTKSDLKELGLPIAARNRILAFQNYYKKYSNPDHLSALFKQQTAS